MIQRLSVRAFLSFSGLFQKRSNEQMMTFLDSSWKATREAWEPIKLKQIAVVRWKSFDRKLSFSLIAHDKVKAGNNKSCLITKKPTKNIATLMSTRVSSIVSNADPNDFFIWNILCNYSHGIYRASFQNLFCVPSSTCHKSVINSHYTNLFNPIKRRLQRGSGKGIINMGGVTVRIWIS